MQLLLYFSPLRSVSKNNFFDKCRWKFFMMWKSNWQLYHERSSVIRGDLHVVYNVARTSFICPLIMEVQIAGRNGIYLLFLCTLFMRSFYALFVCALFIRSFHVLFLCTLFICSFYALFLCALFMRSLYVLFLCTLFICSFYALFLCALFMYAKNIF